MLQVKSYIPTNDAGSSTVALVNFFIPEWGLYLSGCRHMKRKDGGMFVSFPSKKVEAPGQEPRYFSYFAFAKEKNERFQAAAAMSIDKWIQYSREKEASQDVDRWINNNKGSQ